MLLTRGPEGRPRIRYLVAWFAACLVSANLGFGVVLYIIGVTTCSLRALRRPLQGLWLVFFSLATAVTTIPYNYYSRWGGAAPDPYWYWGISIALPAAAAFVGLRLWLSRHHNGRRLGPMPIAVNAFLLATFVAAVYGLARGNGLGIILRQGSGLAFVFFFMFLGRGLAPSPSRMIDVLHGIKGVLVAYGAVYLAHYTYLNLRFIGDLPEGVFLREPSPPLFFCGLFTAIAIGEWLFWKDEKKHAYDSAFWVSTSVMAVATVFSGSRAAVACMFFTIMFFVVLKFARHPVRLFVPLAALALLLALGSPEGIVSSVVKRSSILQHVAGRFLVQPEADSSFLERSSQLVATLQAFVASPVLGQGIGASIVWFDPASLSWVQTAFVDNGFGYLLLKMGLVGTLAFFWLLGFLFKKAWAMWDGTHHAVFLAILASLVYYTAFLPFEPAFFEFLFCFWIATLIGYLLRMQPSHQIIRTLHRAIPATD